MPSKVSKLEWCWLVCAPVDCLPLCGEPLPNGDQHIGCSIEHFTKLIENGKMIKISGARDTSLVWCLRG